MSTSLNFLQTLHHLLRTELLRILHQAHKQIRRTDHNVLNLLLMQPLKLLDKLRIEPELHLMNQIIRQVLEHFLDHAGEKGFPQGFVG